jgi:hypothetical protein
MSNVLTQENEKPAVRYFHGGNRGLQIGDYIVPPEILPKADFAAHPLHRKDRVYVSTSTHFS